jgi:hypothetical protein
MNAMTRLRRSLKLAPAVLEQFTIDLDLATYDAYAAAAAGKDTCLAIGLIVREAQSQAIALQIATLLEQISGANKQATARSVFSLLANFVDTNAFGFSSLSSPDVVEGLIRSLPSAMALLPSQRTTFSAAATAIAQGFTLVEAALPAYCHEGLDAWQLQLMSMHNTRRSEHCAAPLEWDVALAAEAQTAADTCVIVETLNTNAARVMSTSTDPRTAVSDVFIQWYDEQEPHYADLYGASIGPCVGGMNYSLPLAKAQSRFPGVPFREAQSGHVYVCVPATPATRVQAFTQLVWQQHSTIGCALSKACASSDQTLVCKYGNSACTGSSCHGNAIGQFQANVRQADARRPAGPCEARAWPSVETATRAAYVAQAYIPSRVTMLVSGALSTSDFLDQVDASSLAAEAVRANSLPVMMPRPPAPPSPPAPLPSPVAAPTGIVAGNVTPPQHLDYIWGLMFGLLFPAVLLCIGLPCLYRHTGGEIKDWFSMLWLRGSEREKTEATLKIYRNAMEDAFKSHSNPATSWWNMRRDHLNFIKAGGIQQAKGERDTDYAQPYPERPSEAAVGGTASPSKPKDALPSAAPQVAAPQPASLQTSRLLPLEPSIDADLDAEFAEPAEDRIRRLEWIKFYVREGDLQKAFDLGWDGRPWQGSHSGTATPATPAERTISPAPSGSAISVGGESGSGIATAPGTALHRI